VREACEQARVHRYPEAWQSAHQLSRLETALQQIEARVLDLGTPILVLSSGLTQLSPANESK
jgi:hypothetical protein